MHILFLLVLSAAYKSWVLKPADFLFSPDTESHTYLSQGAIGLLSCVHCRSIHEGKPEIGPFNLTNGKYKDAGLSLLLAKAAPLSSIWA